MQDIIDEFYETRVKHLEAFMSSVLRRIKWKILGGIASYVVLIVIFIFVLVYTQNTPIAYYMNIGIAILFGFTTFIFLYYTYRMYFYVSNRIPVKKRIIKKLHLRENGSIDKVYYMAAWVLFIITFLVAIVLLVIVSTDIYSFTISISIISGLSLLIYWTTLTHKTKIKRDFLLIRKFFTHRKVKIRWADIQDVRIHEKEHYDNEGGSYIVFTLYLKTAVTEKPIKLYLGRDQKRPIVEILAAFIRYMRERQGGPPALDSQPIAPPVSGGEVTCPSCGMRIEGPINICPFCGESL